MTLIIGLLYGLLLGVGIVASLVFVANKPEPKPNIISELDIERGDIRRIVRWVSFSIVIIVLCMLIGSCIASI